MAHTEFHTRFSGGGEAVEVGIFDEEVGGEAQSFVAVDEGAVALAITVTAAGPEGFQRGPEGAEVTVRVNGEVDITDDFTEAENGQLTYVTQAPDPGAYYEISIAYEPECDVEINASAPVGGWRNRLRRGWRWFRCKGCKFGIKAFVIALVAELLPLVTAGWGVIEIVDRLGDTLTVVTDILGISEGAQSEFVTFVADLIDHPIDEVLTLICSWIDLCER